MVLWIEAFFDVWRVNMEKYREILYSLHCSSVCFTTKTFSPIHQFSAIFCSKVLLRPALGLQMFIWILTTYLRSLNFTRSLTYYSWPIIRLAAEILFICIYLPASQTKLDVRSNENRKTATKYTFISKPFVFSQFLKQHKLITEAFKTNTMCYMVLEITEINFRVWQSTRLLNSRTEFTYLSFRISELINSKLAIIC